MVLIHDTPHLHTVKKVLLSSADILAFAHVGSRAWDALASAVSNGRYTSTDPDVVSLVTRAERSSGAHLARRSTKCQQPA